MSKMFPNGLEILIDDETLFTLDETDMANTFTAKKTKK